MATNETSKVIHHFRRAALLQDGAGMTDGQLLVEYVRRREEAALAALVRRHGPMVWGVCRRVLHNHHDAEDAFQATFLVFVRKASSIDPPELLANWLYGVAHQTALKARATIAKRRTRERQVMEMPEPALNDQELWSDLQPLLDYELSRLPDKYRVAIVLCDLEGKPRKEAARHLGVPDGTLGARLARGRKMLAGRLARHGVTLSAGALAVVLTENAATASVPTGVVSTTIKAASLFASGKASAVGVISVKAVALTEGVMKTMFLAKLKIATTIVLSMGLLGISWGLYPTRAAMPNEAEQEAAPQPPSASSATDKEGGNPSKKGQDEEKIALPKGPAPVQAVVSLSKDGKLTVKCEHIVVTKRRTGMPPLPVGQMPGPRVVVKDFGGGIGAMMPAHHPKEMSYDLKEAQVFDTKGKEVDKKDLAKLLKEERIAVASFGDQLPDPLHLRILKEDTLVFILPPPPAEALHLPDGIPFLRGDEVLFPGLEREAVSVLFYRQQSLFGEYNAHWIGVKQP
jgi:RNA polymerase sigma factor (sigma-70 family)